MSSFVEDDERIDPLSTLEAEARYGTTDHDRARTDVLGRFAPRRVGTPPSPDSLGGTCSADPPRRSTGGAVVRARDPTAHWHRAPRIGPMDTGPRRPLDLDRLRPRLRASGVISRGRIPVHLLSRNRLAQSRGGRRPGPGLLRPHPVRFCGNPGAWIRIDGASPTAATAQKSRRSTAVRVVNAKMPPRTNATMRNLLGS